MLWIPGWAAPQLAWSDLAAELSVDGAGVVCDFAEARREGDHVEIASHVLDQAGPAVVVGWSLGAMVALELALLHPETVEALVLIGATDRFVAGSDRIGWPERVLTRMRTRLATDVDEVVDDLDRRMFSQSERDRGAEAAWLAARSRERAPSSESLDAGLAYLCGFDIDPHQVGVPVSLLHGREDGVCPLACAERLALGLPRCDLTVWDDVGHVPFWTEPDAFRSWVEESMRRWP